MTSIQLPETAAYIRFREQEGAVQRLGQLLEEPVLREALKILDDIARPRGLPDIQPGVHPDTTVAHHFHLLLGAQKVMQALKKLATPRTKQEIDEDTSPERPEFADYGEKIQKLQITQ